MISRDIIDEIKAKANLKELVERDVTLKREGRRWWGVSPFRSERSASFCVHADNRWSDFGSNEHGDVIEYWMRVRNLSFYEAAKELADELNIPFEPPTPEEQERQYVRQAVSTLQTEIVRRLHAKLRDEHREWIRKSYGVETETVDEAQIGWDDGSLFRTMQADGFAYDELLSTGFFVLRNDVVKDHFWNRLVIPYFVGGKVVYATSRKLDEEMEEKFGTRVEDWEKGFKYKKLLTHDPEKHHYVSPMVRNDYLFNEDALKRPAPYHVLCEGTFDCLTMMQMGVAAATTGESKIPEKQIERILSHLKRAKQIFICNDNDTTDKGDRPGRNGAIATARALWDGHVTNVFLCELPNPENRQKIDTNDFLREARASGDEGADLEAWDQVRKDAKRLPDVLVDDVPDDIDVTSLAKRIDGIIDLLPRIDEIEQNHYVDLIRKRFKQRAPDIRAKIARKKREEKIRIDTAKAAEKKKNAKVTEDFRGNIQEELGYYQLETENGTERISTFSFDIKSIVVDENGQKCIRVDITLVSGKRITDHLIPKEAWTSKRSFISKLPDPAMSWTGSDDNVQGLLAHMMSTPDVPVIHGTTILGYHFFNDKHYFVMPTMTLDENGPVKNPDVVFVSTKQSAISQKVYPKFNRTKGQEVAKQVLELFPLINDQTVSVPILAHALASMIAPRLREKMGHFPIMSIWGTKGCGKTTISRLAWQVQGVQHSTDTNTPRTTPFMWMKTMSSSNCYWNLVDEYRSDLPKTYIELSGQYVRRSYTADIEERGKMDQTSNKFHIVSPLCMVGETKMDNDPAIMERLLIVAPKRGWLRSHPESKHIKDLLKSIPIYVAGPLFASWSLSLDLDALIATARERFKDLVHQTVPDRVNENLVSFLVGVGMMEAYAEKCNAVLPELDLGRILQGLINQVMEGGTDGYVQDSADKFLQDLSTMALTREILPGIHYVQKDQYLYLHLETCIAAHAVWQKKQGVDGMGLSKSNMKQNFIENYERGSYVVDMKVRMPFHMNGRVRCIAINLDKLPSSLDIDFPPPDRPNGEPGGKRRGPPYDSN